MEILVIIAIGFYILSTVGYVLYLFFQKNYLHQAGYFFIIAGFLFHTSAICWKMISSWHIPVTNLYETLSIASWAVAGVFLIFFCKFKLKILGAFAAPLASIIMIFAFYLPRESAVTRDIFKSLWLFFHIIAIFTGEALFALACAIGLLYLVQEHAIKAKCHGFFFKRLPSLDMLDTTGYVCIVAGFTMLTLGLYRTFVYFFWCQFLLKGTSLGIYQMVSGLKCNYELQNSSVICVIS